MVRKSKYINYNFFPHGVQEFLSENDVDSHTYQGSNVKICSP